MSISSHLNYSIVQGFMSSTKVIAKMFEIGEARKQEASKMANCPLHISHLNTGQ